MLVCKLCCCIDSMLNNQLLCYCVLQYRTVRSGTVITFGPANVINVSVPFAETTKIVSDFPMQEIRLHW